MKFGLSERRREVRAAKIPMNLRTIMKFWLTCRLAAVILTGLATAASAQTDRLASRFVPAPLDQTGSIARNPMDPPVRAYLIRGLFDLFSLGMNELAVKLRRQGYWATAQGVAEAEAIEEEVIARRRNGDPRERIVIIGHSMGGDAGIRIANRLADEGLPPLALLVTFDPGARTPIAGGVDKVLNIFQSSGGWSRNLRAAPSFSGVLVNEDTNLRLDMNHLNMERNGRVHARVLALVEDAVAAARAPAPSLLSAPNSTAAAPLPVPRPVPR